MTEGGVGGSEILKICVTSFRNAPLFARVLCIKPLSLVVGRNKSNITLLRNTHFCRSRFGTQTLSQLLSQLIH